MKLRLPVALMSHGGCRMGYVVGTSALEPEQVRGHRTSYRIFEAVETKQETEKNCEESSQK